MLTQLLAGWAASRNLVQKPSRSFLRSSARAQRTRSKLIVECAFVRGSCAVRGSDGPCYRDQDVGDVCCMCVDL